ncbi:hypothetical protein BH09BAC5_BH09BAC5_02910 [soil metagenome]
MSKFKFKIDSKEPQEEQIARHKDFGKVMQNYQHMTNPLYRTPLYRYRKIFIAVLLALMVVWLVAEFGDEIKIKKEVPADTMKAKKDSLIISKDKR